MQVDATTLNPLFGATVTGVDLNTVSDAEFSQIRALFEEHSLLLFPGQELSDAGHKALALRFGPLEDRSSPDLKAKSDFKVPEVSNIREDGSISDAMDLHTLHLKANMLWHADSTFLPIPALTNILTARIVTEQGGATEFASTRAGWAAMPEDMKSQLEGASFWHRYAHSRAKISPELAKLEMFTKWPDQCWRAVWENPVNGQKALYIASHTFAIDGMPEVESVELIEKSMNFVTQPEFTYSHHWAIGDVMIWDQRAVLHRATPWNYEEPRKLSSICVSATSQDGVDAMRAIR